jgi:hypothetical protein
LQQAALSQGKTLPGTVRHAGALELKKTNGKLTQYGGCKK